MLFDWKVLQIPMSALRKSLLSSYRQHNSLILFIGISLSVLGLTRVLGIEVSDAIKGLPIEMLQLVLLGYLGLRLVRAVERIADAHE